MTSHSNLVYQRLKASRTLQNLFDGKQVTVSCLGGGPGSDLLGVLKFMAESEDIPTLRCHILDREIGWADAWSDVDEKLDTECTVSTYFIPMDVTDQESWSANSKYLRADLFTMIYFVSEIFSRREEAEPYFDHLFENMKPGSYVLYIDNNAACFTEWFDSLIKKHGLEIVKADTLKLDLPYDEEKKDLGDYLDKFGPVKLTANVAYRICKKP